jgi:Flp pilus assembly protein TadD
MRGTTTSLAVPVFCLMVSGAALAQYGQGHGILTGDGRMGQIPNSDVGHASDEQTAVGYIREEKYAEAIPYLKRALDQHPRNAEIMVLLGVASGMTGDYPESLAWYQKAIAINPDHKMARENLGILYLKMQDLASAQAQLAELVRLCPDGCTERDELASAVASSQPSQPATPAAPH